MKKIRLIVCIMVMFIGITETVKAECHTERLYSLEAYKTHYDLIDTMNSEGSFGFFNSENIFVKINALGTYYNVSLISNNILTDTGKKYTVSEKNQDDPIYMYIEFDEPIRIEEIIFDIDAINSRTDSNVNKRVYADSYKYCYNEATGHLSVVHGKLLYEGNTNETVKISADNVETSSLLVEFDYDKDNVYTLNYFQISQYSRKEHSGWTSEYIDGANYKNIVICDGSGEYIPDGSFGKWNQEYTTVFSPSVDIISDYVPRITETYSVKYDAQHDGKLAYAATPDDISSYFSDYSSISEWTSTGNLPYKNYYSNGFDNEYIMTSKTEGYRYEVIPYYWDGNSNNAVHKLDSSYCKVFASKSVRPCYKHYGHISYTPANYFDIYISKYRNIVPEEDRKIDSVEYYLCDENMACEFITENNDPNFIYDFTRSGKYYLNAVLKDVYGNSNNKLSELFLIDNELPEIEFRKGNTDYLQLQADIIDVHSGINYYTYQLSDDGGVSYSEKSERFYNNYLELNIHSSGDFRLKVDAVDKAGNTVTAYSDIYSYYVNDISVSDAYGFSYDINATGTVFYRIRNDGDDKSENIMVRIYQDDILKQEDNFEITGYLDGSFTYIGEKSSSKFRIEVVNRDIDTSNNELILTTYAKNHNKMISSQQINRFSGIVCSMANNGIQHDYSENLVLQIIQDKNELTAGSGIEVRINSSYYNECSEVSDFKCTATTDSNFGFKAGFTEGAFSLKELYGYNSGYVYQNMIRDNNIYRLQHLYTDKYTGSLYNFLKYPELLDAGNKWYSSFSSELGSYPYTISGDHLGVNDFILEYSGYYKVNSVYSDKIKIRFVDPENPFPNTRGDLWENLDFFTELKGKVLKIYEIF